MSQAQVFNSSPLNGVVPGVPGERAFPVRDRFDSDPFLLLDHIGPKTLTPGAKMGGGAHPHRGFETVSIYLHGSMDHRDSLGTEVELESGGVQVMNAGSGIQHGGFMKADPNTGRFQEFQLWVNVPAEKKMTPPMVATFDANAIPEWTEGEITQRLLVGKAYGKESPAHTTQPTAILYGRSEGQSTFNRADDFQEHDAWVFVMEGKLTLDGTEAHKGQTLRVPAGDAELSADAKSEWLWMAGVPIQEPVVMGGPFVMNTEEEIQQAYADFRAGKFGEVD